jgi:hydrogenase expression/formation protein HypE
MSSEAPAVFAPACPLPLDGGDRILLGHGSGGKMTAELIARCFLPAFANEYLDKLDDQAVVPVDGARLAFTTDSYVVTPLFFPGGDIGALAVNGTVNDLATAGARPLYLSAAFILEEGFPLGDLVDRGKADGCFITTTGIGVVEHTQRISADRARPGDAVILSGTIADHGMAIMAARADLELETPVTSDTAALHRLVAEVLATGAAIHCLRDPTRGGVATALSEIAQRSKVGIVLDETAIAVREPVRGVCELLGLDPLYVANEGKLLAIVPEADTARVLEAMCKHPEGRDARVIGQVVEDTAALVVLKTTVGGRRIVDMLQGEQLPRIC